MSKDGPPIFKLVEHIVQLSGDVGATRAITSAAAARLDKLETGQLKINDRIGILEANSQPPDIIRKMGDQIGILQTNEQTRDAYVRGRWSFMFSIGSVSGVAGGAIGAAIVIAILKSWGWLI